MTKPKTIARVILSHQLRMAEKRAHQRRIERERKLPVMTGRLWDAGVMRGETR